MIQENLIKFSTFLQQQEMRKKKDNELNDQEERKIQQLKDEINRQNEKLAWYEKMSTKIENQMKSMRKFEQFLEQVKD